ncbi:unnamed protein product [Auanema sp. JU1783]|nr:unnamed protein product [Auanema sp. JU1783]
MSEMQFTEDVILSYREKVRSMFYHAYDGYLNYAFPLDELKPLSCEGVDTWGSFSLSLVDALDTLLVMGNHTEFIRAVELVLKSVKTDVNVNVSVFETNIRVVGGLLSAHMFSGFAEGMELEEGWPCDGPLLRLAERMASRLLPAFNTDTGMPYGTVNLKYGVHKEETPITCTASIGTFLVEFGTLSRLLNKPIYEQVAMRALESLEKHKSKIGLVGNHINVLTGQWTATDSGIGAGVDSYFEYLVKGAALFGRPKLMTHFNDYKAAVEKYIRKEDWFMWVSMFKGGVTFPIFQSLEAFWPGLLVMTGDVDNARRIMLQYAQTIEQYGFPPEFYNIPEGEPTEKRAAYPLRPEMAESLMYLYQATKDPIFLEIGAQLVDAIEHSAKTKCGYGTVHDVRVHDVEDRMESFFLAETTKYLYLLFDTNNFLHNDGSHASLINTTNGECAIAAGGYVYNTEAHPVDPAMLECCYKKSVQDRKTFDEWARNFDGTAVDIDDLIDESLNVRHVPLENKLRYNKPTKKQLKKKFKRQAKKKRGSRNAMLRKIRDLVKAARLLDEQKQQKGEKSSLSRVLSHWLLKMYEEYEDIDDKLNEFTTLSDNEIRSRLLKRHNAEQVLIPQTLSEDNCSPLDYVGESVNFRIMMSHIYKNYIYPNNKIYYLLSPICKFNDAPRIEDNYMNIPPITHDESDSEDEEETTIFGIRALPFDLPEFDDFEDSFEKLRSPHPEFISFFTGGRHVISKTLPKRKVTQ